MPSHLWWHFLEVRIMSFLLLGVIFFVFPIAMIYGFHFLPGTVHGDLMMADLIFGLFIIVGILLMIKGIKKIKTDRDTEKHGELCYCQITAVKFNGTVVNGVKQYDAYARVYVESADLFIPAHESIGEDVYTYREKSFHVVKYYNDDINFQHPVDSFEDLPIHIQARFDDGNIIPDRL